jgi:hypothetical protein
MATDKPRSIVTYVHRPKRPPRQEGPGCGDDHRLGGRELNYKCVTEYCTI